MSLFFITGNQGKFEEVKNLINDIERIDIDLDEIQDLDPEKVVRHKLEQAQHQMSPTDEFIIEDTSLYINELNGLPGPLIKWFLKTLGTDGLSRLTQKLATQTAVAKTIIGYSDAQGQIKFFAGEVEGQIVLPRGDRGFGWDPIFQPNHQPNGETKTFGEMTLAEKEQFSMRKLAVMELKKFLEK